MRLMAFKTCPYVQRVCTILHHKGLDFDITWIDKRAKPDELWELSPRGKVPVLVVGDTPLLESQAICEYLEDAWPEPALRPTDPLLAARDRAWFAYAAEDFFAPTYNMLKNKYAKRFGQWAGTLANHLARLDASLEGREWLSGDGTRFGLADVALAPFLNRAGVLEGLGAWSFPAEHANVTSWAARVRALPAFQAATPDDFVDEVRRGMELDQAWALHANR